MASLFDDPLYTQLYRTGQGLLDPNSPERRRSMSGAMDAVAGRYARAGLTGSGQELQAVQDTAKNLSFDQTIQAMGAANLPIQNWMAADAIKRAQRSGDIQLFVQALAALGIPAAAARELFGIDTTPRVRIAGPETAPPSGGGLVGRGVTSLWNALTGGGGGGQADIAQGLVSAHDFWGDTPQSIAQMAGLIG